MFQFIAGIPIYQQIVSDLKGRMLSGKLKDGDRLPSVRELADVYGVNPNTVQRVFAELERDGLTSTRRGIGTFVSTDPDLLRTLRTQAAQEVMDEFILKVKQLGLSKDDIQEALNAAWDKGEEV